MPRTQGCAGAAIYMDGVSGFVFLTNPNTYIHVAMSREDTTAGMQEVEQRREQLPRSP